MSVSLDRVHRDYRLEIYHSAPLLRWTVVAATIGTVSAFCWQEECALFKEFNALFASNITESFQGMLVNISDVAHANISKAQVMEYVGMFNRSVQTIMTSQFNYIGCQSCPD